MDDRTLELKTLVDSQGIYHIRGELHREYSADLLVSYLSESLPNQTIDIGTSCRSDGINIHLGKAQCGYPAINLNSPAVEPQGYVLKGMDDTNFVIAGSTEQGIENGADEFLERYVGVRWAMPDSNFSHAEWLQLAPAWRPVDANNQELDSVRGDDVPLHSSGWTVPLTEVRESPAFLTRYGTGYGYNTNSSNSVHAQWTHRMRANAMVSAGHNIYNLFPASVYAAGHPEFYPCMTGSCVASSAGRHIPGSDSEDTWSPNFSASALTSAAATELRSFFDDHAELTSSSISLADDLWYMDMTAASFAREPVASGCITNQTSQGCSTKVALNSIGLRDMSWTVFAFANDLIASPQVSDLSDSLLQPSTTLRSTSPPAARCCNISSPTMNSLIPSSRQHLHLVNDMIMASRHHHNNTDHCRGSHPRCARTTHHSAPIPSLTSLNNIIQDD